MADNHPAIALAAWRPYRVGKALLWGGFLLFLPAVPLLALALHALKVPGNPAAVAAFIWMALWVISGLKLAKFVCPACGKRFFIHGRSRSGNLWAGRCCHCGVSPPHNAR